MVWRLNGGPLQELAPLPVASVDAGAVREQPASPVSPKAFICIGLCLIAYVAIFIYASVKSVIVAPYGDPHDWDALVFATEKTGRWLQYLWEPHTNQRIVFARILTYLDVERLGRTHTPVFLIGTVATLLASTAAFATMVYRSIRSRNFAFAIAALVAMLLLDAAASEDCCFPVFSVYIFVSGFAALAFGLMEFGQDRRAGHLLFAAAILGAVLSGFGNAAGLAVWPVLVIMAIRDRQPLWRILVLVGAGAVYIWASMKGLGAPSQHLDKMDFVSPAHLAKMAIYFAGYCGLPWSQVGALKIAGRLLGLVLALLGAGLVLRGPKAEGGLGRVERMGHGLIMFGLLTAVMATVGRVDELPQPIVPTRYFPFTSLLQAGLVLALVVPIQRLWTHRPKAFWGIAVLVAALLLAQQAEGSRRVMTSARRLRAASAAFDAGDHSSKVLELVYFDPARAADVRAELKRRGLPY